jgi:Na+/H+-dicarboxylate symporter
VLTSYVFYGIINTEREREVIKMMVIGLIFAVVFALCAIYFGFGMAVIMIYETFFWASEKAKTFTTS